jgi:glyoxylase-like metal-dependent hydrolase (beta-lactamase superfamily II)
MEDVSALTSLPVILAYTHGHGDHAYPNKYFSEISIHQDDLDLYRKNAGVINKLINRIINPLKASPEEKRAYLGNYAKNKPRINMLRDGDQIDLGGTIIKVIATPGHTKGSACFLDEKNRLLYCGDTISNHVWICLKESTTVSTYIQSLERLRALIDPSYKIIASHSDTPLNAIVLERLLACARNITPDQGERYHNRYCKGSYIYSEGIEILKARYGIGSFEEMVAKIDQVGKDVFSDGLYVSVVFRKEKV